MGVRVTDLITTSSPTDTYATHDSLLGKGGHREVLSHAERDEIPPERRRVGMSVYTANDGEIWILGDDLSTWILSGSNWTKVEW